MKLPLFSGFVTFALLAVSSAAEPVRISSFSTVLTEIAEQVGGDRVAVTAHVKKGVDPHEFEPAPNDLKIVGKAELILLSAKHLEGYVGKLKESTGTRGKILQVGDAFPALMMEDEEHPGGKIEDPHWWHSVANVERAARVVRGQRGPLPVDRPHQPDRDRLQDDRLTVVGADAGR